MIDDELPPGPVGSPEVQKEQLTRVLTDAFHGFIEHPQAPPWSATQDPGEATERALSIIFLDVECGIQIGRGPYGALMADDLVKAGWGIELINECWKLALYDGLIKFLLYEMVEAGSANIHEVQMDEDGNVKLPMTDLDEMLNDENGS